MARGFRIAGTLKEFLADLEVLKDTEHKLIVWQNDADENKNIFDGEFQSYTKEKEDTIINIKLDKNHAFEKENPVYIFEKNKGILFKGRYEYCVNSMLKVLADDRVFLKEKRDFDRFYFNYTKVHCKIDIYLDGDRHIKEQVTLRDVCPGGYGFRFPKKRSKFLKAGLLVEMNHIGGIDLPNAIPGEIVHLSAIKQNIALDSTNDILIGVCFKRTSKLFTQVIEVMKRM